MSEADATANVLLPNENRLELPAELLAAAYPRRGMASARNPTLDADAPAKVAAWLESHPHQVMEGIQAQQSDPAIAQAAREYLDGRPNPVGAGAVESLCRAIGVHHANIGPRPVVDAWISEHGLAFAACAVIESEGIAVLDKATGKPFVNSWRDDRQPFLAEEELDRIIWHWLRSNTSIIRLREVLAAAPEAEYRAVAQALASHRTSDVRRTFAAFAMPTEQAWVDEMCDVNQAGPAYDAPAWLIYASVGSRGQLDAYGAKTIAHHRIDASTVASLAEGMGAASLPILTASLDGSKTADDRSLLVNAVAALPSDAAMDFLLSNLVRHRTAQAARAAVTRFPLRALRCAAELAPGADAGQRTRLAGLLRSITVLDAALAALNEQDRTVINALLDESEVVAAPESLPDLLVSPPWTVKRPKQKAVVIKGLQPPGDHRLVWAAGEREEWSAEAGTGSAEYWSVRIDWAKHNPYWAGELLADAPMKLASKVFAMGVFPTELRVGPRGAMRILARFGADVLPPVVSCAQQDIAVREALIPVLDVDTARMMADGYARLKTVRPVAAEWFDRHGSDAARMLIPDALGKTGKQRRNAEGALRYLVAGHGARTVLDAAATYGDHVAEALRPLLELDPLEPIGGKIPAVGAWADPGMLPPVLLREGGAALPDSAVAHLITVLAIATPEEPYIGIDIVAECCDRESLARFSLALFEHWIASDAPSPDAWALTQLMHFGDDETVRRLTPMVRAWPGESHHKRAVTGLEVLGAIGSEAALRAIHGISEKVKFKALKAEARFQIEAIADELGLSSEQLADRLVPDFGLDDASGLVFDYGPRQFTAGFDEQLKPFVTGPDGKARQSLPKPGVRDDAEVAEASRKRFSQLKKDLRTVAAGQVKRLERAMIAGRTWSAAEFKEFFADHPLVWHLARRLVWLAVSDDRQTAFRLAEDHSPTDVEENGIDLPDEAVIRLAHPLLLGEARSAAWAEILADYEILQPFEQLGRPIMALTDEELKTGALERFEGVTVDYGRILGLTMDGWERAAPEDAGCEPGIFFSMPGGGFVLIELDPGLVVGNVDWSDEQTLRSVRLSDIEGYDWFGTRARSRPPTDIDPVVASEVLVHLTTLTADK